MGIERFFLAITVLMLAALVLWELWAAPEILKNMDPRQPQSSAGVEELWAFPDGTVEGPYFVDVRQEEEVVGETPDTFLIKSTYTEIDPLTDELSWGNDELIAMDKATHMHVSGGDVEREGYATFPLHVEKRDYEITYRHLLGAGTWHFEQEDVRGGLPVYVFSYRVESVDADEEYPEWAPEHVVVDDYGEMAVEPVSGTIVDWTENWEGYRFENGSRVLIDRWYGSFWRSTVGKRVEEAVLKKNFILLVEWVVPAMLLSLALGAGVLQYAAKTPGGG